MTGESTKRFLARTILNIVFPLIIMGLVIFLGPKLVKFFLPFVVGLIISLIVYPIVKFLDRHTFFGKKAAFFITTCFLILLVGLIIFVTISAIVDKAFEAGELISNRWTDIEAWINQAGDTLSSLGFEINGGEELLTKISDFVTSHLQNATTPTVNIVSNIPSYIISIVVSFIAAYLFVVGRPKIGDWMEKKLPGSAWRVIRIMKNNVGTVVGGYFKAQFQIMIGVFVIVFVGCLVMRVHYSYLVAIGAAVADFLPVLGASVVLWPMAAYMVIRGAYWKAIGLLLVNVGTMVFHQVIQPKLIGDNMHLSPMYTIFLLFLGFRFYGIGGMIIAVPIGFIVLEMYKAGVFKTFTGAIKDLVYFTRGIRGLDVKTGLPPEDVEKEDESTIA